MNKYIYPNTTKMHKPMKQGKQSFPIKQFIETLFLAIKMCFTTDVIWMNAMCVVSLANCLRAVADAFRPLRTFQRY